MFHSYSPSNHKPACYKSDPYLFCSLLLQLAFRENNLEDEEKDDHGNTACDECHKKVVIAGATYAAAIGIQRLLNPLQISEITTHAMKYHIA